jgi:hypothetical protein
MKMTNIIVFTPEEADGCSWYRSFGVLGFLPNVQLHRANAVTWASFASMDIAFFQRPYTHKHLTVIRLAASMGCKIWIDFDDLLTSLPRSNPSYAVYKDNCITSILPTADIITVSTNTLASELGKYISGTKIRVIPNAYNDYILTTTYERHASDAPSIMWRGTNSHQGDLHAYAEQLEDAMQQHPEAHFTFVGYDPWMIKQAKNMSVHGSTNIFNYFDFLIQYSPDILLVPLESNIFNMCKSNIAQLEIARCGATVIGPSWLEWDQDLTHMIYYDHYTDLSSAIQHAMEQRAKLSKAALQLNWEVGLYKNRLSIINELRTKIIEWLIND